MKVAIMQPYFLPYIGYFQLINAVDKFVIYDNIEYTKRGWITRNRLQNNGNEFMFSLSLEKSSDFADIADKQLASDWARQKTKIKNQISNAYSKAPEYEKLYPVLISILDYEHLNLFKFIHHSLLQLLSYLSIDTPVIISSSIDAEHQKTGVTRVLDICHKLEAHEYINPIGGQNLYTSEEFSSQNITLRFLKTKDIAYAQSTDNFIPNLSILDLLMYNSKTKVQETLLEYNLI